MIPLATPRNGELINLSQIVQIKTHPAGRCKECEAAEAGTQLVTHVIGQQSACNVYYSDGRTEIFDGDESKYLNIEMHFLLNMYRQFQQQAASPLVGPDGNKPAFSMSRSAISETAGKIQTERQEYF